MAFDNASSQILTAQAGTIIVFRGQEHRSMASVYNYPAAAGSDAFFLILGTEAPSLTKATVVLYPGDLYELPMVKEKDGEEHVYNGQVSGFWLNGGTLNGVLFTTDVYGTF